ncbi:MAG TPA: glycosyltransferase [Bryobacteraceae bacterium]|nr:glycosyltransferase [Bryobacteraceae bacterium]
MPLHIAHFQAGFPVPDGTTTAVHGLSLGLARQGLAVTIYGCGLERDLERMPAHPNVQVHLFRKLSRRGFSVPDALLDRLKRNGDNIDLLVINTMFNPPNLAVAQAARKGRIPYVVSPHDPYHPGLLAKNGIRKRIYTAFFERRLVRRAAAVQVLSPEHTRYLDRFGVRTALVIPNGFSAEDYSALAEETRAVPTQLHGDPCFLCLGRLDAHHKGLDLLIRGFARARRAGVLPETAMINFVGRDNGDLPALRRIAAAEQVSDRLNFTGRVSDRTRRAMLHACDVLLLCSRYDGFGLVALEAMLAAKPVVVSNQAGISTWVEKAEAGILAEPSAAGIEAALTECMKRKNEWRTLGCNGRSFARCRLTWDQVAQHAARCYSELLSTLPHSARRNEPMRVIGLPKSEYFESERMAPKWL